MSVISNGFVIVLAVVVLSAVCLLGAAVGRVASALLRLRWSGRTGLADAALGAALGVAGAGTAALLHLNPSHGPAGALTAAALGVPLRHLARRAGRRDATRPAA